MKIIALFALALPAIADKQCAQNWSQCNGQNWSHGVCCVDPNFTCKYKTQYLSQCEPTKPPVSTPDNGCAEKWSQCNGQNWSRGVCCKDAKFQCMYKSKYLSVCEPNTEPPTTTAAPKRCSENYSQCNGLNWPFDVCCKDPKFSCNYKNQYLSLCEPKK
ncbi:hypothetical protein ACHHYP_17137 [Achlya hypogyna]|uniref:Secreted protein n=1 Tax=Achlya hypogyna TaxID=1202772 RepID=A0A0A7CNR3_ACHHY|nr:secreted protein [Achlya hypogyna]OQR80837.1 hypothetical protein ACHHYP_17137 [Achlya hypogyna]